jgi:hypothetical protein
MFSAINAFAVITLLIIESILLFNHLIFNDSNSFIIIISACPMKSSFVKGYKHNFSINLQFTLFSLMIYVHDM